MEGYYSLSPKRTSLYGNHMTYVQPLLHPDRILDEHDFIYMLEGEWSIWLEATEYILHPGDVLILKAGHRHYGTIPCAPGTKTMFLHTSVDDSSPQVLLPSFIPCRHSPEIPRLFSDIISLSFEQDDYVTEFEKSALFNQLLCQLHRANNSDSTTSRYSVVKSAITLMEATTERFYSLAELTELLNISDKTLNKYFHEAFGMTAYQYQMNLKLKSVHAFLIQFPKEKLKTVAYNFGFYDEFYMSKMFKRKYKLSPSDLRSTHR